MCAYLETDNRRIKYEGTGKCCSAWDKFQLTAFVNQLSGFIEIFLDWLKNEHHASFEFFTASWLRNPFF
jgi:hypothetical protein